MGIYVEIEGVYSVGNGRSDKYTLFCNGSVKMNRYILLKPIEKDNTINHFGSTEVYSIPFSAKTNIVVRIQHQENTWMQIIQIDIFNWRFSVLPYNASSKSLPNELAHILLSSFGIKRGDDRRSLALLAAHYCQRDVV